VSGKIKAPAALSSEKTKLVRGLGGSQSRFGRGDEKKIRVAKSAGSQLSSSSISTHNIHKMLC